MKNLKKDIQSAVNVFRSGNLTKAEEDTKKLIKLNPNIAFLHNLLGLILAGQEKFDGAITSYQDGLKLDPNFAMIYNNLGLLFFNKRSSININKSEDFYKKSISLNSNIAEPHNNLGSLYNSIGKYDDAGKYFKNAIDIDQNFTVAHYNLGSLFITLGKFNDAKKSLKRAIELSPNFIRAHRILSRIIKYSYKEKHLDELINLNKKANMISVNDQVELNFALGKAHEDIKEFDKSFKYYERANFLYRKSINFSIKDEMKNFKIVKNIFNKKLFNKLKGGGSKNKTPIFIIGMPRSGTTLTEQILATHPDVFGADEVETIPYLVKKYFDGKNLNEIFQNFDQRDKNEFKIIGDEYISKMKDFSNNSSRITDKLPLNFFWIGLIKLILPNAKIVHCYRNPEDNIFSIFKNNFTSNKVTYAYKLNEIIDYYNLYFDLMNYWKNLLTNFIYDIKYEKLISNTKNETEKLLKFCDLKWSDKCLEFYNNKRPIKTASDTQVRNKIYKSSIDLWKNYEIYLKEYYDKIEN